MRALLLTDDRYGANWNLEEGAPSIRSALSSFGWELATVSVGGSVEPCAWGAGRGLGPYRTDLLASQVGDLGGYDALVVLPGQAFESLLASEEALELIRRADRAGLAVAAFCRGARALARAGILRGRRMTGHADYENEYLAAGALYVGYSDRKGKSDAPPPIVDGNLVTCMRSNYFRGQACEAIRIAAENARAGRAAAGAPAAADALRAAHAPRERAVFAFALEPGEEGLGLALVRSLRDFGGALSRSPVLVLAPAAAAGGPGGGGLDTAAMEDLAGMGARTLTYETPPELGALPLSNLPFAAARAEAAAESEAEILVWMGPDALILREPSEILLPRGAALGFRPVHHALIGSRVDADPDDYWAAIYAACGAEPGRAFPVLSTIDRIPLRFYPNAGFLALRPGSGLLRAWAASFGAAALSPAVAATYGADRRRPVFSHQAFLAAAIAARLPRAAMRELSFSYNYPLHLHSACPPALAPRALEDLTVLRYDARAAFPGRPESPAAGGGAGGGPAMGEALAAWLRESAP